MGREALPRPRRFGPRFVVVAVILATGLASAAWLRLSPRELVPGEGGARIAAAFFSAALSPALDYERPAPPGTEPLPFKAVRAAGMTVAFAATAMSLAVPAGLLLGMLASSAWWSRGRGGSRLARRSLERAVWAGTRALIGLMRSIHELLWAVLLLAAFGLGTFPAILALAIPYTGTLAKVFSEMIDEAPREAAESLRGLGAPAMSALAFGLLPRAFPDIGAYTFYRFECALRSSAILGFFGFPTLGYFIAASFENLHYGEVWTYLYTLFILVALADWWSGLLRRDFAS